MTNFHHLIILDESGSMGCIRKNALSGCNETIQNIRLLQQKASETEPQQHFLTLVVFNSGRRCHYLYDHKPITECEEISLDAYRPDACTPLYDAIGLSVCHLQDIVSASRKEGENCETLVTIITDGLENSSTVFDSAKVKNLIEEQKKQGWTFAFIGTNIDEVAEAGKLGILNTMHFDQTEEGTRTLFADHFASTVNFCMAAPCEREELRESGFFRKKEKK